eukprot:TRINITY_DN7366_c0_g1_i4.p1 TRINITY_DN7366_c0_g1~~TRINITY_DN7366_c0_g1_i4.p1  ORF type:complete len:436 (-),score=131.36 TRINITY_DN7366_c0_g1_i4:39-1346(-)
MVDYADLPALEQKVAASVTEMVTQHGLNAVLSGAVNAAFEAGSSDPVAFMGNYMVERIDRVPALSELAPKEVLSSACDPVLRVDVSCCVNGVHKVFGSATAPSVAQFEATPVAEAPVEGEQTPEPLPSVQALMEQVRGAALGGMDPRGQQALDAHVLSLGLHPAATITISSALAQAGAAVSSLVSFQPVAPWQHLHAQHAAAPAHMPTMMVPMLSCGPGMHVDLILRGGGGWSAALQQATKVFACLQQREGCTLDVLTGLVCCPAAPAPDPKQKEPKPGHDVLGDALCVMEEAVAAAGLALCVDQGLCFAVWVHADQQCTAQHTEGTDATEEQEAVPASTEYMYDVCPNAAGAGGAPCSTRSEVMVQYYAALVAAHPAVHVLGDPLGAQDQPGWAALVESLHVQTHAELLLAGACLLYTSPSPRDRTRSRMPSSA